MVKLTYRLDGEKEDNMNIIIATLIIAGVPLWQFLANIEYNHISKAIVNIIQIITFILLMRAIM